MILFAIIIILAGAYSGTYGWHSLRHKRILGAVGAIVGFLLCLGMAGLLLWFRN